MRWKKLIIALGVLILIIIGGFLIYTNDFYKADSSVYERLDSNNVSIYEGEDIIVFHANEDKDMEKAFVFYPGGKVEYKAYIPLMDKLSKEGLTTILLKVPLNLAVFDQDAAEKAYPLLPNISNWYIGGHSLGGAMASSYVGKTDRDIKGLILLAAYTEEKDIPAIALYGSKDEVLSREKMNGSYEIIEIEGGNHAYFGDYGEQEGDGVASITREEQQNITVEKIIEFVKNN